MTEDVASKVKKMVVDHLGVAEISDSEAEKILTVGDAIKFIESKSN